MVFFIVVPSWIQTWLLWWLQLVERLHVALDCSATMTGGQLSFKKENQILTSQINLDTKVGLC